MPERRTHLITLHLVLEAGWSADQAIRIRKVAADASAGWTWLEPPESLGVLTIVDVAGAEPHERSLAVRDWVVGCWDAWAAFHGRVRATASQVIGS